jgi:dihydrofolate synthase/folylpolyglutamate synthase
MKLPEIPASIEAVYAYLNQMPIFKKVGASAANFNLEETRALLQAVGNPHMGKAFIHVGGTNGKGSTCALLAAVYASAGYKTGLYTSPHVTVYNERISINGERIPDEAILHFFQTFGSTLQQLEHTYFELATVLAFWWFARNEVDIAIIEVGLGGRLDATNVITPLVSVITSIGYDHTDILGPTLTHIASEKAGIIKPGVPVVIGNIDGEALVPIRRKATDTGSPMMFASEEKPRWNDGNVLLAESCVHYPCGLEGEAQPWNVAMVAKTVGALQYRFPVSENDFRRGIQNVHMLVSLPGRFERLKPGKNWFFDGGHNAEALSLSAETVQRLAGNTPFVVIFSMMRDKLTKEALSPFLDTDEIWYHPVESERAATFAEFASVAVNARHLDNLQTLKAIVNRYPDRFVFFLGSFYFYNTVKDWITKL